MSWLPGRGGESRSPQRAMGSYSSGALQQCGQCGKSFNLAIWENADYAEATNEELAREYDELWRGLDAWCAENLTGEDAEYYYRTTD